MARAHPPNQRLRSLLVEARWSGGQLAAAVNTLGGESGRALRYDRSTVAHWLAGTLPRPPAPAMIAEALSRRLGREVTAEQMGFVGPDAGADHDSAHWAVEDDVPAVFARLAATHPGREERSGQQTGCVYSLAALMVPGFEHADALRSAHAAHPGGYRVEMFEVRSAEALLELFHADDAAFGGGHGRRALSAYLAADLAPRLDGYAAPAVRRRLLAVAGQLAYQCAFMHFDDGLHGPAQAYYRAALSLAAANGDSTAYGVALRGLSVQAHALGHRRHALQLAEAAASGSTAPPMTRAFVYGQLAVAYAAGQAKHDAVTALSVAERYLEQASGDRVVLSGAYHQSSLLYTQAQVRALLGDTAGAVTALANSVRNRPAFERRSRAIVLAELAQLRLSCGHLDQAVATWHQFLDEHPYIQSGRADTAVKALRAQIRPFARNAAARALLDRASTHTAGIRN